MGDAAICKHIFLWMSPMEIYGALDSVSLTTHFFFFFIIYPSLGQLAAKTFSKPAYFSCLFPELFDLFSTLSLSFCLFFFF